MLQLLRFVFSRFAVCTFCLTFQYLHMKFCIIALLYVLFSFVIPFSQFLVFLSVSSLYLYLLLLMIISKFTCLCRRSFCCFFVLFVFVCVFRCFCLAACYSTLLASCRSFYVIYVFFSLSLSLFLFFLRVKFCGFRGKSGHGNTPSPCSLTLALSLSLPLPPSLYFFHQA